MMGTPVTVEEHFAELGKPEHVGNAFMLSEEFMRKRFGDDASRMPAMPYDYRVLRDIYSGNVMVLRARADGTYQALSDMEEIPRGDPVDRAACQV